MAQDGDTITYTYDSDLDDNIDLIPEQEDVSSVDQATVEYCDGAGGSSGDTTVAGTGGRVENATIDLSNKDTLYIFVAGLRFGRYDGLADAGISGGGSTEITFSDTNQTDSSDEPFLVASAGGGSGWDSGGFNDANSNGGARGGDGFGGGGAGEGVAPPVGGDGAADSNDTGSDGDGAIDDQNRGLVSGGTTITGGGSGPDTNAEVRISYGVSAPDAPTNLTATLK